MRVSSTLLSLSVHTAAAVALIQASAASRPVEPRTILVVNIPPEPGPSGPQGAGLVLPAAPTIPAIGDLPFSPNIPVPALPSPPLAGGITSSGRLRAGPVVPGWSREPIDAALADEYPELLAAPAPTYPELLRQAGVEGGVVLEAVIDTGGKVEGSSIVVIAGHPVFAAAAQRSLVASLFRPARVRGRAVRVRVRLPFEFRLSGGRRGAGGGSP